MPLDLVRPDRPDHGLRVVGPSFADDMVRQAAQSLGAALPPGEDGLPRRRHPVRVPVAFGPEAGRLLGAARREARCRLALVEHRFAASTAIGVSPIVLGKTDPRDALRTSYGATQGARASGKAAGACSPDKDRAHARRFELLSDFGAPLEAPDQLTLVVQPPVELASGRCVGAGAWPCWTHPLLGAVSPGEFIPIIEQASLAKPTTAQDLDAALRRLDAWRDEGPDLQLSITTSAASLEKGDFAERVRLCLLEHHLGSGMIEREPAESAVMENAGRAMALRRDGRRRDDPRRHGLRGRARLPPLTAAGGGVPGAADHRPRPRGPSRSSTVQRQPNGPVGAVTLPTCARSGMAATLEA